MNKFDELKNLLASLERDMDQFYNKGNRSAGTRVRKGMQTLKDLAQLVRVEILGMRNKASMEEDDALSPPDENMAGPDFGEDEAGGGGPRRTDK